MTNIYRRSSDGCAAGDSVPFKHGDTYHLYHLSVPLDSLGHQYPYRCKTSQRHAVSKDLVTWEELPVALEPGPDDYDKDGAWTGSIIEKDGTFFLFYTGHQAGVAQSQTICVSTSRDGVHFEKSASNPILRPDPGVFEEFDFRDPFIFWNEEESRYWMLIAARHAAGPERRRGVVALSTSQDLVSWSPAEPFYSPWNTMCHECPEMFRLGDWWYLVFSHFSENMKTTYRVSRSSRGPWKAPGRAGLDGRRLYAAKSLGDGDRRILWGSVYERVGQDNDTPWTYAGDFGVPRELRGRSDGILAVRLPDEIRASFARPVPFRLRERMGNWSGSGGSVTGSADQALAYAFLQAGEERSQMLECTVTAGEGYSPFGILLRPSEDLEPAFALVFEPARRTVSIMQYPQSLDPFWASLTKARVPPYEIDGPRLVERPLDFEAGDRLRVAIVVEGSLIDAFVGDEVSLAYRAYPTGGEAALFGLFVEDGTVRFDDVSIKSNDR